MHDELLEMQPDPDAELMWLVQQCQDGDAEAILVFIRRYSKLVFPLCATLRLSNDGNDTLVIETFVGVFSRLSKYHGDAKIEIWLACEAIRAWKKFSDTKETQLLTEFEATSLQQNERIAYSLAISGKFSANEISLALQTSVERFIAWLQIAQESLASVPELKSKIDMAIEAAWDYPVDESPEHLRSMTNDIIALGNERKIHHRRRLVAFEVVWAVLGIILLVGTFRTVNILFPDSTSTPTLENQEVLFSTATPTPGPSPTPTSTPRPFELTQANAPSHSPAVSADGRYVVFVSLANNLVPGDTNNVADIFLFDREAGMIERVNLNDAGEQANDTSAGPSISSDGRFVAFVSWASNLTPGDQNLCPDSLNIPRSCADVYLRDRSTGETILLSQFDGIAGDGHSGNLVMPGGVFEVMTSISGDGSRVAFTTQASNLVGSERYNALMVVDPITKEIWRVDQTHDGSPPNGYSYWPNLSADGRFLAFQTDASNLVDDDLNGALDVYVYDLDEGQLLRVTTGREGTGGKGHSRMPSISNDGRYLAFRSGAWDLVEADENNADDIFLYDLDESRTYLITVLPDGIQADGHSTNPVISGDGRYVVFTSLAGNLVDGDHNGTWQIYLYDLVDGNIRRLSQTEGGLVGNQPSHSPVISGDGTYLLFTSAATNLVPNDVNGVEDLFMVERLERRLRRVNIPRIR